MMCRLNYLRNSLCPADGKCLESKRMNARKKELKIIPWKLSENDLSAVLDLKAERVGGNKFLLQFNWVKQQFQLWMC